MPFVLAFSLSNCSKDDDSDTPQQQIPNGNNDSIPENNQPTEIEGLTVSGKIGSYTYVDLGLKNGTLWATCNVGATKPTESGYFFAWGEVSPKADYSWATYKWCNGNSNSLTKYSDTDGKMMLDADDDAATANWGEGWRMPTKEELQELNAGCKWEWRRNYNGSGVSGRLGTSISNGATIFLPFAGYYEGSVLIASNYNGYSLASSLDKDFQTQSTILAYNSAAIGLNSQMRYVGQSVRAVAKK